MSLPLVTVTLLNWNDRRTIFAAIDSVANTRYSNLELILIDNASRDGTPEEIERCLPEWTQMRTVALGQAPEDSWFSFIRNKENIGFAKGHNKAIERAHGEYIVCLNADAMLISFPIVIMFYKHFYVVLGKVWAYLLTGKYDANEEKGDIGERKAMSPLSYYAKCHNKQ